MLALARIVALLWRQLRALIIAVPSLVLVGWNVLVAYRAFSIAWKLSIIVAVLYLVPVPDFVAALPGRISALPPAFWYFANLVELRFGIGVLCTALLYRFIIRRIVGAVGT